MLRENKKKNYFLNQRNYLYQNFRKLNKKRSSYVFCWTRGNKKTKFLMLGFAMKQAVKKEKKNKF